MTVTLFGPYTKLLHGNMYYTFAYLLFSLVPYNINNKTYFKCIFAPDKPIETFIFQGGH